MFRLPGSTMSPRLIRMTAPKRIQPKPIKQQLRRGCGALAITALAMGLSQPARALDDAGVATKLAQIPVLVPTDGNGKPLIVNQTVNGQATPVLFGAFSPEAAEALAGQVISTQTKVKPQFSPANLIAFEELFTTLRKQQPSLIRSYVPDPVQQPAVVGLLVEQGAKPADALQAARTQPVVFCPDPLVQVNIKRDQSTQTTVPCGLDFREMAIFVLGPRLQAKRPGLVALPLDRLVALLKQLKGTDGDNLRIVASPSMQALLARLSQAAPTTKSKTSPKQAAPAAQATPSAATGAAGSAQPDAKTTEANPASSGKP
jgi:hypothetical protein